MTCTSIKMKNKVETKFLNSELAVRLTNMFFCPIGCHLQDMEEYRKRVRQQAKKYPSAL